MSRSRSYLLTAARHSIERWREKAPHSAVLWSGGKDSMVMLHLLHTAGLRPPVVFFREPWQPRKYAFHDRLIRDWGLQVLSWHPSMVAFQATGGEFELQNVYFLDEGSFSCPTGIVPPEDGKPWACAVDMARRPTQGPLKTRAPFQAFWIGHKASDTDAVLGGAAGTGVDAALRADGALAFFPLREWCDADVWWYIKEFDVPYDKARYGYVDQEGGYPAEWPDRRDNVDYVHACTACIDPRPDAPRFVHCPKLDARVVNCAEAVPWTEPVRTRYMLDEAAETPT